MMSDYRGGGRGSKMTPKNRIIEGKNRIKWGGGVKNDSKKLDIIYAWSQSGARAPPGGGKAKPTLVLWMQQREKLYESCSNVVEVLRGTFNHANRIDSKLKSTLKFMFIPHCIFFVKDHSSFEWLAKLENKIFKFGLISTYCCFNSPSAYVATLTELHGVKINGFLYPNFM